MLTSKFSSFLFRMCCIGYYFYEKKSPTTKVMGDFITTLSDYTDSAYTPEWFRDKMSICTLTKLKLKLVLAATTWAANYTRCHSQSRNNDCNCYFTHFNLY
jgi:hypothetical protein